MRISDWSSDVCSTDHLWSTRAIVAWEPSDRFRANIIWQHFEEDDNRSRTGKQLCTRDPGPATIGGVVVPENIQGRLSQGCLPGSLYDDAAYGTPNASGYAAVVAGNSGYVRMGYIPGTYDLVRSEEHTYELQSLMRISY